MSERDRRLAEKYERKGRESATARKARLDREKAQKKASRQTSAKRSEVQRSEAEFDPAAFYDQHRNTSQSRQNRRNHQRNIPTDVQSGGGETFAERSARSITAWTRSWFR